MKIVSPAKSKASVPSCCCAVEFKIVVFVHEIILEGASGIVALEYLFSLCQVVGNRISRVEPEMNYGIVRTQALDDHRFDDIVGRCYDEIPDNAHHVAVDAVSVLDDRTDGIFEPHGKDRLLVEQEGGAVGGIGIQIYVPACDELSSRCAYEILIGFILDKIDLLIGFPCCPATRDRKRRQRPR